MDDYRWTVRAAVIGVGFLALAAVVALVLRIFGGVIAGVQPEAWALGAMMTAPFTIGVVVTIATALVETVARVKRRAIGVRVRR